MRAQSFDGCELETVNFPAIGVKEELAIPLTLPTPLASVWHRVGLAVAEPHMAPSAKG